MTGDPYRVSRPAKTFAQPKELEAILPGFVFPLFRRGSFALRSKTAGV